MASFSPESLLCLNCLIYVGDWRYSQNFLDYSQTEKKSMSEFVFLLCKSIRTAIGSHASWSRRYWSLKGEHSLAPQALCNLHDLLFLSIPHSNFCRMMTFATWPTTPAVLSVISSATPGEWRSFEYHFFPVGPGLQLEVCLVVLPPRPHLHNPFWDCANAASCNIFDKFL